jgi:predicted AAA+ superfamily ATPase
MYDLRAFRSNSDSRSRLDSVVSTYYIGEPYFSVSEAERVLHTIIEGRTLKDTLNEFFEKKLEKRLEGRMKEMADYRVCAAHDIAPIVERAFGVRPGDLKKNKGFVKLVDKGGLGALDDGAVWRGIGKR